jgi:hypothetical protein
MRDSRRKRDCLSLATASERKECARGGELKLPKREKVAWRRRYGRGEGEPETIAQNDLRPKCERLAVRENEIRHREFRVDQLQHLSTNFVH